MIIIKKVEIENIIINLMEAYIEVVSFFDCSKCGMCCKKSPNLIFSDELMIIDKSFIYRKDGLYGIKDPCPYLVENKCKIHDHKPRICKFAPFIIGNEIGQIIIKDCDLGKNITNKYNIFIEETNLDISNMTNPFNNVYIINSFLDWLKIRR